MKSLQVQLALCSKVRWLFGLAAGAGLALFYIAGYRPATQRLGALTTQIESRQRELDRASSRVRNLPVLATQVQQLETRVQSFDRQLPGQPGFDRFIKDITDISNELNLRDWRFSPGAPVRGGGYFEMPIQMQFTGDFLSAAAFVRRIEDLQRLTRAKKLNIKSKDPMTGMVEVEVVLNIYFSEG